MAIIVKRFKVRHNGVTYGPGQPGGQIIEGLSEKEEAFLIEHSNGSIERYANAKTKQKQEKEVPVSVDAEGLIKHKKKKR